jgi:GTP-binding protein
MAQYIVQRRSLAGVVLLLDSRLGFTDLDQRLLRLLAPRLAGGVVRLLVLLTKSDKLTRQAGALALREAAAVLARDGPEHAKVDLALFSALNGSGVDDVAIRLQDWVRSGGGLQTTT